MLLKHVCAASVGFCLFLGTAAWSSAASESPSIASAQQVFFQPAFGPATAGCPAAAMGGNCDTDADCPSGQFCYNDPIAFVPYCAPRNGDTTLELAD